MSGPIITVMITSVVTVLLFFIPGLEKVQQQLLDVSIIVSGFAMLIGIDSLLLFHARRVQRRQNTFFSAALLAAFFITVGWGIRDWTLFGSPFNPSAPFMWLFRNVYLPLDATMFSILAFYIASAAYRAFRARNRNALLLLISASIIMIGRILYAHVIFPIAVSVFLLLVAIWLIKTSRRIYGEERLVRLILAVVLIGGSAFLLAPPVFKAVGNSIEPLTDWIMNTPQNAAKRGMFLGLTFGSIAFSLRVMFGIERSWTR